MCHVSCGGGEKVEVGGPVMNLFLLSQFPPEHLVAVVPCHLVWLGSARVVMAKLPWMSEGLPFSVCVCARARC